MVLQGPNRHSERAFHPITNGLVVWLRVLCRQFGDSIWGEQHVFAPHTLQGDQHEVECINDK